MYSYEDVSHQPRGFRGFRKATTEAEAWMLLAEKLAARGLELWGLCYELIVMRAAHKISRTLWLQMHNRLQYHLRHRVWICKAEEVEPRILACLLLALDATDHPAH